MMFLQYAHGKLLCVMCQLQLEKIIHHRQLQKVGLLANFSLKRKSSNDHHIPQRPHPMSAQRFQVEVRNEERLMQEYEEWLYEQDFIGCKYDWFAAVDGATYYDDFIEERYGR